MASQDHSGQRMGRFADHAADIDAHSFVYIRLTGLVASLEKLDTEQRRILGFKLMENIQYALLLDRLRAAEAFDLNARVRGMIARS